MTRNRSKSSPKTAAELMAELQKDPGYRARIEAHERQKQENVEHYQRMAAPLLKDLEAHGFRVNSVSELVQSGTQYQSAVPILLQWLPVISDQQVKEDIIRGLSVPWASPLAAPALIREFRSAQDVDLRWAIANGLSVVADDAVLDELVQLVRDPHFGKAREMLALALGNMRSPQAVPVLMDLLDDEAVVGHAVMALGKLKATPARSRLEELTRHRTPWIRKEAKKALAEFGPLPPH